LVSNTVTLVGPTGPQGPAGAIGPTGYSTLSSLFDVSIPPTTLLNGYVLTYNGQVGKWQPQPVPVQNRVYLSVSITGPMNPGEVLMQYAIPESVTIPIGGAAGTSAIASISAQGYVTCIINKNLQQVGTIIWAPGSKIGTIIIPNKIYLIAGDVLQIVAPSVSDPTLANIGITFSGVKGG
jgi:hypothetical protein